MKSKALLNCLNYNNKDIEKILAYLHIQKSQYDAGIRVLEDYYNDNSEERDFDYFINMGVCHKANEDYELSLKMYEEATKIDPNSHMCYTVPAEIYLKLRNFKALQRGLEFDMMSGAYYYRIFNSRK